MEIQFSWKIPTVDVLSQEDGMENCIGTVHWRLHATYDGTVECSTYGIQSLDKPNEENFIEFNNVNKETIVSWLEKAIGEEQLNAVKEFLKNDLDNLVKPKIKTIAVNF